MKTKRETIEELAHSVLPKLGAYLVQVQTRGERGETVVQVLADTDAGITIGECAVISRELARGIEERSLFEDRYRLEVSSPGLERPLKVIRQYEKNVGRPFKVRHTTPDGEVAEELILKGVDGTRILFEGPDGTARTIEFDEIEECRHKLPW